MVLCQWISKLPQQRAYGQSQGQPEVGVFFLKRICYGNHSIHISLSSRNRNYLAKLFHDIGQQRTRLWKRVGFTLSPIYSQSFRRKPPYFYFTSWCGNIQRKQRRGKESVEESRCSFLKTLQKLPTFLFYSKTRGDPRLRERNTFSSPWFRQKASYNSSRVFRLMKNKILFPETIDSWLGFYRELLFDNFKVYWQQIQIVFVFRLDISLVFPREGERCKLPLFRGWLKDWPLSKSIFLISHLNEYEAVNLLNIRYFQLRTDNDLILYSTWLINSWATLPHSWGQGCFQPLT